jgi:hypothetical protein
VITLVLELLLGYLGASALVTFILIRLFRHTDERAQVAQIIEFEPGALGRHRDDAPPSIHTRAA